MLQDRKVYCLLQDRKVYCLLQDRKVYCWNRCYRTGKYTVCYRTGKYTVCYRTGKYTVCYRTGKYTVEIDVTGPESILFVTGPESILFVTGPENLLFTGPARRVRASFSPEIVQAEVVKGLMEPDWATLVRRDGSGTTGDKFKRLCRLVSRGTRFESASALLSLQKLSCHIVPHNKWNIKTPLIAAHLNAGVILVVSVYI